MAEIVYFGLQQHKIKMDSRYFENVLSVVAGDTGRRLEVQLLDTNGTVQDTTGLNLRLNAEIAGKSTFTDATLVDAATGKYQLDLSNGMFLAPGNWQFQWQITDSAGKKLHSFAFTGNVGSNISEGGSQATNFYLNLEDLKAMQDDLVNGTIDSSILETNITEKLTDLETQYAPKLTEVTAQLAQTELKVDGLKNGLGETFGSFTELEATYPTGDTKDHIVAENGHRYYWDSSWKDGGLWNAIAVGDKSIKQKHLAFTVPEGHVGKNKYNKNSEKIVTGVFVNKTDGKLYANTSYEVYTMSVIAGEKIVINWLDQTAFYDINGVYISGGGVVYSRGAGALDVPTNAVIMKTSVFISKRNVFQIEYATSVTSYEEYKIILNDNVIPESRILEIVKGGVHVSKTTVSSIIARMMTGATLNIKLIGDSITNGVGGTGYDTSGAQIAQGRYVNVNGYCWANELRDYVQEKFSNVSVLNYGISGITADFIDRNKSTLITSSDDIVVVMLGTNNRGNENTDYLYTSLINVGNYIKLFGNEVIFMSNIPASVSNESDKFYHMEDVDNTVSRVANQFNQEYISVYKEFIKYCDYKGIEIDSLLGDGLHPNDDGYSVMYKIIASKLGFGIKRPNASW